MSDHSKMVSYEVYGITHVRKISSYAYLDDPEYRDHAVVARDSDTNEFMGEFPTMTAFRAEYPGAEIVRCIEEGNTLCVWC